MIKNLNKKDIWTIVSLIGAYLVFQAIADIGATKLIQLGNIVLPAGTIIFTLTFTIRDLIHKRLGKEWARACIIIAGILNIIMAVYLAIMAKIPSPVFFELNDSWNNIFVLMPSITLGSICAEVISELIDTELYHGWKTKFTKFPQWTGVLASNVVSLPIDSLIFASLAFTILPVILGGTTLPLSAALSLSMGQIVWKAIVTVVSLPLIYLIKEDNKTI